jgi:hypothetical protein
MICSSVNRAFFIVLRLPLIECRTADPVLAADIRCRRRQRFGGLRPRIVQTQALDDPLFAKSLRVMSVLLEPDSTLLRASFRRAGQHRQRDK